MEIISDRVVKDKRMLFRSGWEIFIGKERRKRKRMRIKMRKKQEKKRGMTGEGHQQIK